MQKIDNEVWKDIPGYEGLYEASSLGRIRSLNYLGNTGKTKVLSPVHQGRGYLQLGLCKNRKRKMLLVQRIIYTTFKGEIPPGMTVDHVNNDKRDNRPENLQLLTRGDNARKANLGRKHSPEHRAKISEARKGRKHSHETIAKIAATQKARHQREKNAGKISH